MEVIPEVTSEKISTKTGRPRHRPPRIIHRRHGNVISKSHTNPRICGGTNLFRWYVAAVVRAAYALWVGGPGKALITFTPRCRAVDQRDIDIALGLAAHLSTARQTEEQAQH